jgi:hypothetical protein
MVLTELLHKGVVHGLNTAIIHKLVASSLFDKYVEVARGSVVTGGVNGRIEILVPDASGTDGHILVKAGSLLARRVPPVPGVDGMDVFGNPLPAPQVADIELHGGAGTVVMSDDPDVMVAEYDGVFERDSQGVIAVRPYREIAGDVGNDTGNVEFDGSLKVTGAVRAGFKVDVTGSLEVMGPVEDAVINCGGDLLMHDGARGVNGLVIECGGNVWAGCIERAKLDATGDVTVEGDIFHANVVSGGEVKARSIFGGSVSADCGIFATQAGSDNGLRTVLDVGAAHGYARKRDALKSSITTQNLLSEGHISELYSCVRDNMDEEGRVPAAVIPVYERFVETVKESLATSLGFEEELRELEFKIEGTASCSISVSEVHPNVVLRLGFSEQHVREFMKNVYLRPAGVA